MPALVNADLHLDMWLHQGRDPFTALDPQPLQSLDALIIAGDLSNKPKIRWPQMIDHLGQYIAPDRIHILPGNHDYYGLALDDDARLATICAEAGADFAQKARIVTSDIRFLCCTLWTDFALHGNPAQAMMIAQRDMNDYQYIRHAGSGYRRFQPSDTALIHVEHRIWLEERLIEPYAGQTIVVTHHCPHPDLIGARRGDLDPIYGSNLLPLIERYQPQGWLFGHTHYRVDGLAGHTFIRNVSLGYPDQVPCGAERAILLRGLVTTDGTKGMEMLRTRAGRADIAAARNILNQAVPDVPQDEGDE